MCSSLGIGSHLVPMCYFGFSIGNLAELAWLVAPHELQMVSSISDKLVAFSVQPSLVQFPMVSFGQTLYVILELGQFHHDRQMAHLALDFLSKPSFLLHCLLLVVHLQLRMD
jgi:hypothetical protein